MRKTSLTILKLFKLIFLMYLSYILPLLDGKIKLIKFFSIKKLVLFKCF